MHLMTHRTLFHPTSRETTMQLFRLLIAAACALGTLPALAQTTVKDPWVRGTVAQQKATGAFMQITSTQGGKLVSAASPLAGVVEIHEMKMEGNVMKMAAVAGLDLPAGKTVELKPGGQHIPVTAANRHEFVRLYTQVREGRVEDPGPGP